MIKRSLEITPKINLNIKKIIQIPNDENLFEKYNNDSVLNKNFKYFSEIVLLTNTKDLYNMIDWLYWHINIAGIDHIMVVDNGAINGLKTVCDMFDNVDYYYEEIHEQAILLNKYFAISEAKYTASIDEDEYIYVNNMKINDVLCMAEISQPNVYKFSLSWINLFSKQMLKSKDPMQSYIETFNCIYNSNNYIEEDNLNYIKTFINKNINHYMINTNNYKEIKLSAIDLVTIDNSTGIDSSNVSIGTVHNPLTLLNKKILPSFNLSNNKYNYGYTNENTNNDINIFPTNICLIHYKYRTEDEWISKIKYNKFPDVNVGYYNRLYNMDKYYTMYNKYSNNFVQYNNLVEIYLQYKNDINKLKQQI